MHEVFFIISHAKSESENAENLTKIDFFNPKQSQMDDKDRTIRIQQSMIDLFEKEKSKIAESNMLPAFDAKSIETANCATQTDRVSLRLIEKVFGVKLN